MRRMKGLSVITIICIVIIIALPIRYFIVSCGIMYPYSRIVKNRAFFKNEGLNIEIPGGLATKDRDWYPFMLYYNDFLGFSKYMGRNLSLSILYNFGHFYPLKGYSSFFDENSDYYSSFYGGYIIRDYNGKFAFKRDELDIEEASKIPEYDYLNLVLHRLGCPRDKMKFEVEVKNILEDVNYIGLDNWYRVDSIITTNGVAHEGRKGIKPYIQYGKPRIKSIKEEFPIIQLRGRSYIRYIEEKNVTVFLYIMAPHEEVINNCDNNILSKTIIEY